MQQRPYKKSKILPSGLRLKPLSEFSLKKTSSFQKLKSLNDGKLDSKIDSQHSRFYDKSYSKYYHRLQFIDKKRVIEKTRWDTITYDEMECPFCNEIIKFSVQTRYKVAYVRCKDHGMFCYHA
jgi:hypothetical protein